MPARLHARGFGDRDRRADREPERRRHLLEVVHRRTRHLRVEQKARPLDLFADQESHRREHRHATVRELRLAVSLERRPVDAVAESEHVESLRERRRRPDESRRGGLLNVRVVLTLREHARGRRADGGLDAHGVDDDRRHRALSVCEFVRHSDARVARSVRRAPRIIPSMTSRDVTRFARVRSCGRGASRDFDSFRATSVGFQ